MFKKRANNKKIDLNQELSEIPVVSQIQQVQVEDSSPQGSKLEEISLGPKISSRQKFKPNFITLQALQKTQIAEIKPLEREFTQIKKEEINDYLNEIRNFKPVETAQQENEQLNMRNNTMVIVQQNNGYNSQDYDDNEMIEVQQDFQGGFSPQHENEYHEDYEDQLIKRTLTKHNYEQLRLRGGPMLSDLKAVQSRDKLLQKIEKVSAKKIENTIKRDLEHKRKKYEQIQQQIRMKKYTAQRQKNEMLKKEKRLNDLKKELENVNKVIEYLYYYGDKVNVFDKGAILKQIEGQEKPSMLYNYDDVE